VRLITATNRDLEAMIKEGKFREDLYYRLNAVTINIPPLRERKEDIPQLAEYFITKYAWECHKVKSSLSAEALRKLRGYNWPGNVRELENVLRKAVLFNKGSVILPEQIIIAEPSAARNKDLNTQLQKLLGECVKLGIGCRAGALYKDLIEETEKALIMETIKQVDGNQSQAAKILGISRPTLKDKIEKLGLKKIVSLR